MLADIDDSILFIRRPVGWPPRGMCGSHACSRTTQPSRHKVDRGSVMLLQ